MFNLFKSKIKLHDNVIIVRPDLNGIQGEVIYIRQDSPYPYTVMYDLPGYPGCVRVFKRDELEKLF
jgi:hypothetical protein